MKANEALERHEYLAIRDGLIEKQIKNRKFENREKVHIESNIPKPYRISSM